VGRDVTMTSAHILQHRREAHRLGIAKKRQERARIRESRPAQNEAIRLLACQAATKFDRGWPLRGAAGPNPDQHPRQHHRRGAGCQAARAPIHGVWWLGLRTAGFDGTSMLYISYNMSFHQWRQPMKLEIKKIGNSTGIILPKDLLARLGLAQGDAVHVTELPDRAVKLSVYDPDNEKVMEIGREVMREYRETFKALAK
jgi:putative addiction module antidote